ncbi:MAG: hypothetical protein FWG77_04975 [Treponema sp.]|nr:hypothetical protein [Treponema sp.]
MKKAPQSELIRGQATNPIIPDKILKVKSTIGVPPDVIRKFESELQGIDFGGVSLIVTFRNRLPAFRIEKIVSVMTTVREPANGR